MYRVNHGSPLQNPLMGDCPEDEDSSASMYSPPSDKGDSSSREGGKLRERRFTTSAEKRAKAGSSTRMLALARTDTLEFALWLLALVLLSVSFLRSGRTRLSDNVRTSTKASSNPTSVSTALPATLISYSHHETAAKQVHNLGFYLRHGQLGPYESFVQTVYTVSGPRCKICDNMVTSMSLMPVKDGKGAYPHGTVTEASRLGSVTLLRRKEEYGWEFANHNVTLEWLTDKSPSSLRGVKFFVFVGSSVQGPFLPSYFSHSTHWTQAFTGLLNAHVKLVAPSVVCLPSNDDAGPGAHLDSYVFATDIVGLGVAQRSGALNIHRDNKLVRINNHYGLTKALFEANYKVTTLLYKYGDSIDWQDPSNWNCNDLVPPDRECSYDSITQHPFETVFVKASLQSRIALPRTVRKYSHWADAKLMGTATRGRFDMARYMAAIHHHPMCEST